MRRCFALGVLIGALFAHGAALAEDPAAAAKAFKDTYLEPDSVAVLGGWAGEDTAIAKKSAERIMDQDAWVAVWQRHDPAHTPPAVDFAKAMVIAIFTGDVTAAFYNLHLHNVSLWGDRTEVTSEIFISDVIRHQLARSYLFVVLPRSKNKVLVLQRIAGVMMWPEISYETLEEFEGLP